MEVRINSVFSLDIDGTISDYPDHWLKFLSSRVGEEFTSTSMAKSILGLSLYYEHKRAWRLGPEKYQIPVRNELLEFTRAIYKAGGQVFINSQRPFDKYPAMREQTIEWLNLNGFYFEDVGPKSIQAVNNQAAIYHLDDEISEALRIAHAPRIKRVGLICKNDDLFLENSQKLKNSEKVSAINLKSLLEVLET